MMGTQVVNNGGGTPPVGRVIARSRNRMLSEDGKSPAPEMSYGTNPIVKNLMPGSEEWAKDEAGARYAMFELFNVGTSGAKTPKMRNISDKMLDQFWSKQGGDFRNGDLDRMIKEDARYQNFLNQFGLELEKQLNANGGDIEKLKDMPFLIPQAMKPKFRDHTEGLGITVDGVNYIVVVLTKFTVKPGGSYTAEVQVQMYDSFGVDESDIEKLTRNEKSGWDWLWHQKNVFLGWFMKSRFIAWWTLQHVFGCKPLRTVIINNETLSGTINKK
jgi:hypothetical protein